jgi:heme A synthase
VIDERAARWSHRIAVCSAVLVFAMLTLGGLVTSLKAGLAYLTWPSSDGHFFNPPGWMQERDTLVEHGHRLLGQVIGIAGLTQLAWFWLKEPGRALRWIMALAFLIGGVQAVLGGTRVLERSSNLAFLHGCVGHLFLALVVAMAYLTSRDGRAARPPEPGPRLLRAAAISLLSLLCLQIIVGAQRRHLGSTAALQAHLLGALMVFGGASATVALALTRHRLERLLLRPALVIGALVLIQAGLGFGALHVLASYEGGWHTPRQALLPSLHQVTGALLLTVTVVLALRTHRRCGALLSGQPAGAPA